MNIIAHRGSSLIWPENTLLAFDKAHLAGATGFETDLRLSKNNEIILSHDSNLDQFGYPNKAIHTLTTEQIVNTKISSKDNRFRDNLITLKTLLQKYPDKSYIFDCKISDKRFFEILKDLLTELKFHDRIWFLTWSSQADKYVREIFTGYHCFPREFRTQIWGWFSLIKLGRLFEPTNNILALPAYYLDLPVFTKRQIANIYKRGKRFVGYLVNSEKEFRYCMKCSVNTVLTDIPDFISKL